MTSDTVPLYWGRDSEFVDYETDQAFPGEGVYQVPSKWEGHYRSRGWEDPPEDHEGEPETPKSAINRNLDGPSRDEMEGASTPDGANAGGENADADGDGGSGN